MNPRPAPHSPTPEERDELAAFALDAVDADEAVALEARLLADPAAADVEALLREAAGEFAAAVTVEVTPPPALRGRVLAAALAARPADATLPAGAVDVHRIEADRLGALLRRLTPEQWRSSLDPPEFAGWTVHDVAAHLTGNESLLARLLGITDPLAPETELDNESRAHATVARHRTLGAAATVAEYETFVAAVDTHVAGLTDEQLAAEIDWWGMPMMIRTALLVRAFETWTHADDIRRACGLPSLPPPVPSLATMSSTAVGWLPIMLALRGEEAPGKRARVVLTGAWEATHDVDLTEGVLELAAGAAPDVELRLDVVDFCRAVADRVGPAGLTYEAEGDTELAATIAAAIPALATL